MQGIALHIWQAFLIIFVCLLFAGSAWLLASSLWSGDGRRRSFLMAILICLAGAATYGSWLSGDEYLSLHEDSDSICGFVAGPGIVADLLVYNRTDIPENDPDTWATAWLVAPASAVFWTGSLVGIERVLKFCIVRLRLMHRYRPGGTNRT